MTMTRDPPLNSYDLLIVGGGINGAGIARDAAGRGLSVLLVEQDDLAAHTSSASTKLVHGGLRYLEYGEFRLVREALMERERLWAMAPHIIWPLSFVLPQRGALRPAWMVRLGLWLYDHLGGRKRLPATRSVDLARGPLGQGLVDAVKGRAFVYSDCWVEDSRLVVLNAMDARARGATVLTRTRLLAANREDGHWLAAIRDSDGQQRQVQARGLVNAAGPWVAEVLGRIAGAPQDRAMRLVQGSHIVLPRLYDGDHAFLLQNNDRRVVFAIPYEQDFTLIGTTDEVWDQAPGRATISTKERDYLLDVVRRHFTRPVGEADIVWTYSGIRPLYDDKASNASAVTRDYVLDLDQREGQAPLLSVFGGKITTYRKLAEHALEKLEAAFPQAGPAWTGGATLPGGDFPAEGFGELVDAFCRERPGLPRALLTRWARAYGTNAPQLFAQAHSIADLGEDFGGGLHAAELAYLAQHEWAVTAEDVVARRSKLLLRLAPEAWPRIDAWLAQWREARQG
ncbi:glycerol-3-phosphate dehydrogenase [Novosphingobium sp. SG720]|uniref:glycerol-3-phosphate dehydrogenase n=1 Tax=Novosphingobium sp. SG720 TaxID=2586998 RepID=UPI00144549FF|nr:glycerol-3-phosphate dehydrogenase [Novosphingobium sp. SG720]NKJ42173.1 glycerol-3-phosphate dehydrogenase [Novosphingobium sp. SG720]